MQNGKFQSEGTMWIPIRKNSSEIAYPITHLEMLCEDLGKVRDVLARNLLPRHRHIHAQLEEIDGSLSLLAFPEELSVMVVRKVQLQRFLDDFLTLALEIMEGAMDSKASSYWDKRTANALKKTLKRLDKTIAGEVRMSEVFKATAVNADEIKDCRLIIIPSKLVFPELQEAFKVRPVTTVSVEVVAETEKKANLNSELKEALTKISSDALQAFHETEDLISEVTPLVDTPEDEYFMEQITDDYFPHILASVRKFGTSVVDFEQKETIVLESIKQFKIIQLGLQKIIDNTVARNLASIKSQTTFLQNKVLGEQSLSLTSNGVEQGIEEALAEAQRIREELYKKHVAPILQKNKEEYEEKLQTIRQNNEKAYKGQQLKFDKALHNYEQEFKKAAIEQLNELAKTLDEEHQSKIAAYRVKSKEAVAKAVRTQYEQTLKQHNQQVSDLTNHYEQLIARLTHEHEYKISTLLNKTVNNGTESKQSSANELKNRKRATAEEITEVEVELNETPSAKSYSRSKKQSSANAWTYDECDFCIGCVNCENTTSSFFSNKLEFNQIYSNKLEYNRIHDFADHKAIFRQEEPKRSVVWENGNRGDDYLEPEW